MCPHSFAPIYLLACVCPHTHTHTHTHVALLSTIDLDIENCDFQPSLTHFFLDPFRPLVFMSRILNLNGEGCDSLEYEGVDYGTRPTAVYDISDLTAPKLMGYFTIDEWEYRTVSKMSFGSDGTTVAVHMQAAGLVFYDFTDPVNPVVLSETLKVTGMNEEAVRTTPYTLGYLDTREAAPGRWFAIASSDGITSSIEVLTLSPSSSDAPAPEPAPESDP